MLQTEKLPSSPDIQPFNYHFTLRELEVLNLVVEGYSNAEIATELHISLSTVKSHICNIHSKLGVKNRVQIAVLALRIGIV